jgi:SWI/SNF-related matrix-associated actin-dependent regulator 1 of chromatin subfamily A
MTKRYKELRALNLDLIIWDEAHYLKGNRKKVKRVAAAFQLRSPFVLFLSGTPFLNRPIELFNMLDMAQPGHWNLGSYGTRYCGGFNYWGGPLQGAMNLGELKSKLQSVMIRRLKRDVLPQLPPLQRVILPADIRTDEYKEALRDINRTNAMTKIMDAWHIIGREKAKVAVEWVKDFFEQSEPTTKLVVYAHHLDVIDYLKQELMEYGSFSIDGRIEPGKRDALTRGFQTGPRPRVAIINRAGGEGVDLFGIDDIDSSTILFVERQWTPALEAQAEGRLDRIGQRNAVTAYYLMAIGTFDEPMDEKIEGKRRILSATMKMEEIETQIRGEIINGILA